MKTGTPRIIMGSVVVRIANMNLTLSFVQPDAHVLLLSHRG
jgi:hypothetical protein